MGNPQFAVPSLEKLLSSSHEVAAVVTSPDRPKGRGKKLCSPAVAEYARSHNLDLIQQEDLAEEGFLAKLSALTVALFVVVAFRILPVRLFSIPSLGAINLHASLLPKYRGAAPIQWALINGEKFTGLTTFLIEKKVDTGGILLQDRIDIKPDETADELSARMAEMGGDLLVNTLNLLESGDYTPRQQDKSGVTKAPKISPRDGLIDWSWPAEKIVNLIRGLSSKPGAHTYFEGKKLKIYRAGVIEPPESSQQPGQVIRSDPKSGLIVGTGDGAVQVIEIQMEGKKRLLCCDYLRGCSITEGHVFT